MRNVKYNTKTNIDVYYTSSVSDFTPRIAEYLAILDKNEQATAERFKFTGLRERYIICHGILRQLLAERVNQLPVKLNIEKAKFGKPFLPEHPDVSFNMSHSGDILAIAISFRCQLGIDVESYKARNTWGGLVKKCFASEEIDYWYRLNKNERSRAFYQFWVKKEAFVKAVGKGITLGLDKCVINPENFSSFLRVPEVAGAASQWHIYTLNISDNDFTAIVCDKKNMLLSIKSLDFTDITSG